MKKIIGLDVGTVTFTPGIAGVGTLVFAGIPAFSPARLMLVTNITRDVIIYSAEKAAKGGAWTSLTDTGGTLTLTITTSGHNAADVLRHIYESNFAEEFTIAHRGGKQRNILFTDIPGWYQQSGTTITGNVGVGPNGWPAHKIRMSGASLGASVQMYMAGRSDGALFKLSFWVKALSANQQYIIQWDFGLYPSVSSHRVGSSSVVLPENVWEYVEFTFQCPFDKLWLITALWYTTPGADVSALYSEAMLEQVTDEQRGREYSIPIPRTQSSSNPAAYWTCNLPTTTSVAWWGDSLTGGSSGGSPREALERLLGNGYVYDGGVGGEISTQIMERATGPIWEASTAYNLGQYRVNGAIMYKCSQAGTSAASGGPTGFSTGITDGTAKWDFYAIAEYITSKNNAGVVVIWAGNNNASDFQTVIDDIDTMVGNLDHSRFLIVGLLNNVTASLDGLYYTGYRQVGKINAYLAHKYGTKYIDARRLVCTQSPSGSTNNIYLYDTIHLTPVGHALIGEAVYQAIRRNGYFADKHIIGTDALTERNGMAWDRVIRPTNTTAYDIGDLIADTVTAGDVEPLALCIPFDHKIRRIRLSKSDDGLTNAQFRVHMFGKSPTVSNGDNGAFLTDMAVFYVGYVDITMASVFTDGACGWAEIGSNATAMGQTACTGGLFVLLEARAAYAPASAEKFTVAVEYGI